MTDINGHSVLTRTMAANGHGPKRNRRRVQTTIDDRTFDRLKVWAIANGKSMDAAIRHIIKRRIFRD